MVFEVEGNLPTHTFSQTQFPVPSDWVICPLFETGNRSCGVNSRGWTVVNVCVGRSCSIALSLDGVTIQLVKMVLQWFLAVPEPLSLIKNQFELAIWFFKDSKFLNVSFFNTLSLFLAAFNLRTLTSLTINISQVSGCSFCSWGVCSQNGVSLTEQQCVLGNPAGRVKPTQTFLSVCHQTGMILIPVTRSGWNKSFENVYVCMCVCLSHRHTENSHHYTSPSWLVTMATEHFHVSSPF